MDFGYIIEAKRSPRGLGKSKGSLYQITPVDLLSQLVNAVLPKELPVESMITGCVTPIHEQGTNIARAAVFKSNLPTTTLGMQINRFCTSSLDALTILSSQIATKQVDLCIASGVESLSRIPMLSDGGAILSDPSLVYPNNIIPQGVSADVIATLEGFSRKELDEYACLSHKRALHAYKNNLFRSIHPIKNILGHTVLSEDELPRDTSLETLSKLTPSFSKLGKAFNHLALSEHPNLKEILHFHHAGNSSGIVDGSSAALLCSQKALSTYGLKPKAKIISYAFHAEDATSLTAPITAIKKALNNASLTTKDIDLWEINEAFSSVVLSITKRLNIPLDIVNVNGGAIALGHPLGATGIMLLSTLMDELIHQDKEYGAITLCSATGMASCLIIKRL